MIHSSSRFSGFATPYFTLSNIGRQSLGDLCKFEEEFETRGESAEVLKALSGVVEGLRNMRPLRLRIRPPTRPLLARAHQTDLPIRRGARPSPGRNDDKEVLWVEYCGSSLAESPAG